MTTDSAAPATYVLALDEGTTNAKAHAIAPDGSVLASGSAAVAVSYPRPGWVEQDAEAVWAAQTAAIRDCLAGVAGPPAGIAISNQRESVVVWDAVTGEALAPILGWQDSRTAEFCDWLRSPEREFAVASTTGLSLDPMFSAPKMRYLLDRVPGAVVAGRARIGTIDSWLVGRLTGQRSYVIEAGNASRTLLLDLAGLDWSAAMCELFGVDRALLPDVVPSDADFGTTSGLDVLPDGVPVIGVLGDSHAAHLTPFIDIVGKQEGFAADVISSNSCGVALGFLLPQSDRRANRCNPYNHFIAQKVKNYPVVFISQRWFLHTDKPGFTEHFGKMLDTLIQQGKQVYVFADTPMNAQLPLRHYYLKQRLGIDMQYVSEHKKAEIARSAEADKTIESIVKQRPAVHWVNIMTSIPADKTIDGLPIYFDTNHLNTHGATKLAEKFIQDKQILLK